MYVCIQINAVALEGKLQHSFQTNEILTKVHNKGFHNFTLHVTRVCMCILQALHILFA